LRYPEEGGRGVLFPKIIPIAKIVVIPHTLAIDWKGYE